jgi:DNA adenine methylase
MKPFFKWSGGKRKEISFIEKHIPEHKTYYEPFVGGGALWLHLAPTSAIINDSYPDLINFYKVLRSDPKKLIHTINDLSKSYKDEVSNLQVDEGLECIIEEKNYLIAHLKKEIQNASDNLHDELKSVGARIESSKPFTTKKMKKLILEYELLNEELDPRKQNLKDLKEGLNQEFQKIADKYYYHYRNTDFKDAFNQAVRFYILRQLSFSGMLRFSSDGKYNIPFGWYKSFKGIEQDPAEFKRVLENAEILCTDWASAVRSASKEDFVFLDPPYTRVFNKYHPNGAFGEPEHERLAEWFKKKTTNALIIINKDEFTTNLYKGYIVDEHDHRYAVQYRDRMTTKDSNATHFIAKNY